MAPFDVHLHYFDKHRLSFIKEQKLPNLIYHESIEDLVSVCDVINISCPLPYR